MSSSIQYNPNPPRVWSRVQNPCSVIAYKNDDPGANSDFARADYERQMLLKGNILQYKKNSSNLTKKQRYTQIAKGMWTNRTKTWATQSDTYTNPNMTSLLRVNSTILDPSNNTFSSPPNPFGCPTTEIQDGGNLVCNVVVDPCTQEVVKRTRSQQLCNPTTDSDVPGQIQELCWNDGTQTWYPRQRYIMPTSGTKWPQGYKGFVSAVTFVGPVLTVGNIGCGLVIPLNWTFLDNTCIPITSFNIYQNDVLILNVPGSQTSVTINETVSGTYNFYVTLLSNDIESEKSNIVSVNTQIGYIITGKYTATYVNGIVTILFDTPGTNTLQLTCNSINNCNLICVGGGGGGGGGGGYSGQSNNNGGGGGGGGGIGYLNTTIGIGLYTITVGSGGYNGGGHNSGSSGTESSFKQNTINYLTGTGGEYGHGISSGSVGGAGGIATSAFVYTSYNGGNGAGVSNSGINGLPTSPVMPITINGINYYFSGGGAGGNNTSPLFGGGAGSNGNGGIAKASSTVNGINAVSYGSGGGGASGTSGIINALGGLGAQGIVIIQFAYP